MLIGPGKFCNSALSCFGVVLSTGWPSREALMRSNSGPDRKSNPGLRGVCDRVDPILYPCTWGRFMLLEI
jgi:hypothetical protein